jgi:hypothetical protein
VDGDDVCPGDYFVDSRGILEGYCVSYVGEFTIFEDEEVVLLCQSLKVWN